MKFSRSGKLSPGVISPPHHSSTYILKLLTASFWRQGQAKAAESDSIGQVADNF